MNSLFKEILAGLIILFTAFWLITSTRSVRVKKRESASSSFFHSALLISGFIIVFWNRFQIGPLALRFIPQDLRLEIIGTSIAAIGIGFAIWARTILGKNWSSTVSINEDQQLIQRGPYAIVRNPIYTGAIFYMLGTVFVSGELCGVLGFCLVLISVWHKAKTEERFLANEFGDEYRDYQKKVKFIIPFIV